jgi:hypothetical protein
MCYLLVLKKFYFANDNILIYMNNKTVIQIMGGGGVKISSSIVEVLCKAKPPVLN